MWNTEPCLSGVVVETLGMLLVAEVSFQEASPFTVTNPAQFGVTMTSLVCAQAQQPQQASHVPQTHPSSPQRCSST